MYFLNKPWKYKKKLKGDLKKQNKIMSWSHRTVVCFREKIILWSLEIELVFPFKISSRSQVNKVCFYEKITSWSWEMKKLTQKIWITNCTMLNIQISLPVIEFSEVLSCSLSLSTSSGWTCSYKELPNHSDWDWLSTGVRESDTYITRPVSAATTKRKPSAASRIKCFSSYSEQKWLISKCTCMK